MAVLKVGSIGSAVRDAQAALNFHGAKPKLKIDGDFGPKTEAAVWQIQKMFGKFKTTRVSGKIDADMATSLRSKIPGRPLFDVWPLDDYLRINSDILDHYYKIEARKNGLIKRLEKIEKRGLGSMAMAFVKKAEIETQYKKFEATMKKKFHAIDPIVGAQADFVKSWPSKKGQLALQKAESLEGKLPGNLKKLPKKIEPFLKKMESEIKKMESGK